MRLVLVLAEENHRTAFVDGVCAWIARNPARRWRMTDVTGTPPRQWAACIAERTPAGVLIACPKPKWWRHLPLRGLPCVRVLDSCAGEAPAVASDARAVAALALGHLRSLGLRRFAVAGNPSSPDAERRRQAFVAACSGTPCPVAPVVPGTAQGVRALTDWLSGLRTPVGIFAISDRAALAVADAAERLGLEVPRAVAILGCGDSRRCVMRAPALSSVDLDDRAQGETAMRLLDRLTVDGRRPTTDRIEVPPRGVSVRASTDPAIAAALPTRAALQLIREREGNIGVADAAAGAGVSARRLQQLFRAELRTSPRAEIARERLRHAERLLLEGRLSLHAVAHACGFGSAEAFSRAFRRGVGQPPSRWLRARRR